MGIIEGFRDIVENQVEKKTENAMDTEFIRRV